MKSESLKKRFDYKNNSFTILSIIASLLIIYFHSYDLFYGREHKISDIFTTIFVGENLGSVIVAMFFTVSGFMITNSIRNSKNMKQYLYKRVKKIYPPLIFCLVVCACVIAPIISTIPKIEFLKNISLYYHYILDNILMFKNTVYGIADVFLNNPYPVAINGSIWTLKHQIFMYLLIIPLFYLYFKNGKEKRDNYKYFFILIFIITCISYTGYYDNIITSISKRFNFIGILVEGKMLIRLIYYFCVGIFFNLYSDYIIYNKKNLIISCLILILTIRNQLFSYVCMLLIPYFTFFLGTIKNKISIHDYSYQIYIWGFPVQQLVMYYLNGKINIYVYILICIITTFFVGVICYYITEYPFNRKVKKKI